MDTIQLIAEPRRREILAMIWEGEKASGEIADAFDVTFGAVSQHLALLREAGLVDVRKDGNRRFYSANRVRLAPYETILKEMWSDSLRDLAAQIEADLD